jgi:hypothetical protein
MGQVLGSAQRRRLAEKAHPLHRQLIFIGMLIIDGIIIDPGKWQAREAWDYVADDFNYLLSPG